jgi:hypothetical protein
MRITRILWGRKCQTDGFLGELPGIFTDKNLYFTD